MLVRETFHLAPVTVPPECTLEEAAALMASHGVGSLLVVTGGQLIGIVTDRDMVVRGLATGRSTLATVRGVMTERPVTIQGSADILEAFGIFKTVGVRRLPVVEEDQIAGIVSVDDLLVWLVLELGAVTTPAAREVLATRI